MTKRTVEYLELNRKLWNAWARAHVKSEFYDVEGFLAGRSSLQDIELALLPPLEGTSLLHLQCHFGQDSLSLARMGARVTGVDLSDEAIGIARELNDRMGLDARFVNCDLYSLPDHLDEKFGLVFSSYGTITWLPDLDRWAGVVKNALTPGGTLLLVEFHPFVWMYDPNFTEIEYPYFNRGPIRETAEGSYGDARAETMDFIGFNHSLSETIGALLRQGLQLTRFEEYDYSPYNIFPVLHETAPGRYQIRGMEGKLPLVYAIECRLPR